jgi:8-oxo-dGTP pyrophosphatase MutT (NUDIX family)
LIWYTEFGIPNLKTTFKGLRASELLASRTIQKRTRTIADHIWYTRYITETCPLSSEVLGWPNRASVRIFRLKLGSVQCPLCSSRAGEGCVIQRFLPGFVKRGWVVPGGRVGKSESPAWSAQVTGDAVLIARTRCASLTLSDGSFRAHFRRRSGLSRRFRISYTLLEMYRSQIFRSRTDEHGLMSSMAPQSPIRSLDLDPDDAGRPLHDQDRRRAFDHDQPVFIREGGARFEAEP